MRPLQERGTETVAWRLLACLEGSSRYQRGGLSLVRLTCLQRLVWTAAENKLRRCTSPSSSHRMGHEDCRDVKCFGPDKEPPSRLVEGRTRRKNQALHRAAPAGTYERSVTTRSTNRTERQTPPTSPELPSSRVTALDTELRFPPLAQG